MPVHDAMYTHSMAVKLQKVVDPETNSEFYQELENIKAKAVAASSESAKAVVNMFAALDYAMNCDDPKIAAEANKIFHGSYNAEIA